MREGSRDLGAIDTRESSVVRLRQPHGHDLGYHGGNRASPPAIRQGKREARRAVESSGRPWRRIRETLFTGEEWIMNCETWLEPLKALVVPTRGRTCQE